MERQYIVALIAVVVVGGLLLSRAEGTYHLPYRNIPTISGGGPTPLTPQERVILMKMGGLESAGQAAKARGDYVAAERYYRAEVQVPQAFIPPWTWDDLGLMLDYNGKRKEAFAAYQKGFGNHMAGCGRPEAAARYGLMCEDAGFHAQACECYYGLRTCESIPLFPDFTLDPKTTSPSLVRAILYAALGNEMEMQNNFRQRTRLEQKQSADALIAFRAAVKLVPGDPRFRYFLADGLCRAGHFAEAEAALQQASRLDKTGQFKAEIANSLAKIQGRIQ